MPRGLHRSTLGPDCARCHTEETWRPFGQVEMHAHTRFPLIGVHASTSCYRCHPGAKVGYFVPTDVECLTCHQTDLARAVKPEPHRAGLGRSLRRCHLPRTWNQAEINN